MNTTTNAAHETRAQQIARIRAAMGADPAYEVAHHAKARRLPWHARRLVTDALDGVSAYGSDACAAARVAYAATEVQS